MWSPPEVTKESSGEGYPDDSSFIPEKLERFRLGPRPRCEIAALYNAVSFYNRNTGRLFNTHITISPSVAGITDHKECARILSQVLHEAGKWLLRGETLVTRRRRSYRQLWGSSDFSYVYVHENTREIGMHTHVLTDVTRLQLKPFRDWFRYRAGHYCRQAGATDDISGSLVRVRWHQSHVESDNVWRQWLWFRYVTKSLDPDLGYYDPDGRPVTMRELFKTDNFGPSEPMACSKISGCSHSISEGARRRAGFRSRAERGDYTRLYDGHELEEYKQGVVHQKVQSKLDI